jgi:hypothetical protein
MYLPPHKKRKFKENEKNECAVFQLTLSYCYDNTFYERI